MAQPLGYRLTCSAKSVDRKDAGGLGKSDPYLVFRVTHPYTGKEVEVFRSEVIHNDLNPKWKPFEIDFEQVGGPTNAIRVECYDYDEDGTHDFIGAFTTTLTAMAKTGFDEPLINPKASRPFYKNSGVFKVTNVEPLLALTPCFGYKLTLHGKKLERKDANGSSDPFLVVLANPLPQDSMPGNPQAAAAAAQPAALKSKKSKKKTKRNKDEGEIGSKKVIYKTEVIKKNLNPQWKSFDLSVAECGGLDAPVTIDCYDWDNDGKIDYIGSVKTTLRQMGNVGMQWPIKNPDKGGPRRNSGTLLTTASVKLTTPPPGRPFGYKLTISAEKLDRKDLRGSDPYFRVESAPYGTPNTALQYKSETLKKTLKGTWKPFPLTVAGCGGFDAPVTITFWDEDKVTKDDMIGVVRTTLRELLTARPGQPLLRVVNEKREESRGALYRNSGIISVQWEVDPTALAPQQFGYGGPVPYGAPPPGYPGGPPPGYPGAPPPGYPGAPPPGYPPQGYPPQGYPPQGYPPQGYPPQPYPGAPPPGYPPQAYGAPPPGYGGPPPGYPPQQHPYPAAQYPQQPPPQGGQ